MLLSGQFPELSGNSYEVRKIFVDEIPIRRPGPELQLIEWLVILMHSGEGLESERSLVAQLIDACVMECYFGEHMAERDLQFQNELAVVMRNAKSLASPALQRKALDEIVKAMEGPGSPLAERLNAIPERSPDLLGVIQKEAEIHEGSGSTQ